MAYRVEFVLVIQKPELLIVNTNIGMQGTGSGKLDLFFYLPYCIPFPAGKGPFAPYPAND